jgi:hypothetical protein
MQICEKDSDERLRYIKYCRNPFRKSDIVSTEFDELLIIPEVQHIAFHNEDILMIGTSLISITHPQSNHVHDIGEFIIYLYRHRAGRIWETGFCFENIRGTIKDFHHPHISSKEVLDLGDMGILCIQKGHFHIYQHIRSGDIPTAVKLLLQVLHTYTMRGPFLPLESWPRRKQT